MAKNREKGQNCFPLSPHCASLPSPDSTSSTPFRPRPSCAKSPPQLAQNHFQRHLSLDRVLNLPTARPSNSLFLLALYGLNSHIIRVRFPKRYYFKVDTTHEQTTLLLLKSSHRKSSPDLRCDRDMTQQRVASSYIKGNKVIELHNQKF